MPADPEARQNLQIQQNFKHQRREWTIQRVGWVIMTLFVLASAIGLLGHGGLAKQELKTGNLAMEYQRFARYEAPAMITVSVENPADDPVRIWMDADYAHRIRFDRIVPEPATTRLGPDRLVFEFSTDPGQHSIRVTFHYTPEAIGPAGGRIGLVNGPIGSFWQFIYP